MSDQASVGMSEIEELEWSISDEEIDRSPLHVAHHSTGDYFCGLGSDPSVGRVGATANPCHPHYVRGTSFCANCGRPWCKECKRILDLINA